MFAATLAAQPSLHSSRSMVIRGAGDSGLSRTTLPNEYLSSIISPTTSILFIALWFDILRPSDNIERSPDYFLMDVRYIEPDESERHEHYPDHDRIDNHHDSDIREIQVKQSDFVEYLEKKDSARECGDKKTDISDKFEWKKRKRGQIIDCKTDKFPIIIRGGAMDSLFCIENESDFPESEPIDESAIHSVLLTESEIGVYDRPINEPIVRRSWLQLEFGNCVKKSVERLGRGSFEP